jgi:hypothetical protein
MISFIVPTLWNSNYIHQSIASFKKSNRGEFILIDNLNSNFTDKDLTVVKNKTNNFVNPSWNQGVSIAKYDYVCLLNDDITFNFTTLLNNFERLTEDSNHGIIAFNGINLTNALNDDNDILSPQKTNMRGFGFGCMMLLKKADYIPIPDDIKVYFGDDILNVSLASILKRQTYIIPDLKAKGEISVTSSKFQHFMDIEHPMYEKFICRLTPDYIYNLMPYRK